MEHGANVRRTFQFLLVINALKAKHVGPYKQLILGQDRQDLSNSHDTFAIGVDVDFMVVICFPIAHVSPPLLTIYSRGEPSK